MLKVIQDCSGFALLRLVIAPENSRLSLNQSDAKRFFPRALYSQVDFALSSLWRLKVFSLPLIDRFDKFGFVLRHLIEERALCLLLMGILRHGKFEHVGMHHDCVQGEL